MMENFSGIEKEDDRMELPPGFRFHPSDEELITHYLSKKYFANNFSARAIGDVDMNKVEPWDLPCKIFRPMLSVFLSSIPLCFSLKWMI